MTKPPKRHSRGVLVLLGMAYAFLCLAEFLITWAKDWVGEELKGKPPEDDDK